MAAHSSAPVWTIPWTEQPGGSSLSGHEESDVTEQLTLSLSPQQSEEGTDSQPVAKNEAYRK